MVDLVLLILAKAWPYLATILAGLGLYIGVTAKARRAGRNAERLRTLQQQEKNRRDAEALIEQSRRARADARADLATPASPGSVRKNKRDKYRRD